MPRKTIWEQHRGRFVRHLHSLNHCRRAERNAMQRHGTCHHGYHIMSDDCTEYDWGTYDHAVIRNPRTKPLLHRGRKP